MDPSVRELRLAWGLFLLAAGSTILPPATGPGVPLAWGLVAAAGSVILLSASRASRAAAALAEVARERRARLQGVVILSLLAASAAVFSPSAALFLATILTALLWMATRRGAPGARALLDHSSALGAALVIVLLPLELVVRLPAIGRQFGLPEERIRREASYDRIWERNVFHLRSPYERIARRPGVRRVLALGDSFTWGLYITDSDSTWPARLERLLGDSTEVINMGQRGWTTYNEAEFLTRLGWQFDPDLVLVQYYLNDAYESEPNFHYREGERVYLLPEQFWQGYVQTSALSALVSRAVNGLVYGILLRRVETEGRYTESSRGWQQLTAGLRQIGDSARARGTPVLLILFPDLIAGTWTAESYPARDIHEQVAREARAAGLLVFDLAPTFAAEGGDWKRWWATPYDAHPNEAAYAVAARAIADRIRQLDLLPPDAITGDPAFQSAGPPR